MRSTRAATSGSRTSIGAAVLGNGEQHAGLLEELARGGDPEGERIDPVDRGDEPGRRRGARPRHRASASAVASAGSSLPPGNA